MTSMDHLDDGGVTDAAMAAAPSVLPSQRVAGTALVVGGTGALGQAICRELASQWAGVAFTTFNAGSRAKALAHELRGLCHISFAQADLRDEQAVERAFALPAKMPPLRGVVFAAGADISQPFVSTIDQRNWDDVLELELKGLIRVVRSALPLLRLDGGVLVTVGSFATHRFPPGDAISAVPKAGMEMLTRAIAREEGRYGIRANTVAPGIIDDGVGMRVQQRAFTEDIWAQQRNRVPLRRFGSADDVAAAVAFLASPRSAYITGQTLIVDGGLHI